MVKKLAQTKTAVFIYGVALTLVMVFTTATTYTSKTPVNTHKKEYKLLKSLCNMLGYKMKLMREYADDLGAKLREKENN